jgi:ubiquinol-cytochrome c reductase iron-sulfur subunit
MSNDEINEGRRHFLTVATVVVGAVGAVMAAVPFVASMEPSARAKALGEPVDLDVSKIEPGAQIKVKWRGKPVWAVQRSQTAVAALPKMDGRLRDPASDEPQQPNYCKNEQRSIRPELFVVIGVCTHLGCSPSYKPLPNDPDPQLGGDWPGGVFCPCHGSKYDLAGRVFKGVPAPLNLQVPPYRFVNDGLIRVGEDQGAA